MRLGRTAVGLFVLAAGAALLVWYIDRIGHDAIVRGLSAVGAGFLVILLASLLRYTARAAAWIALLRTPAPFSRVLAATIGGDAIGVVTPLGVLVGEPAKAIYLNREVGSSGTLAPLAAENFFYGVSLAVYILLGAGAMLIAYSLPDAMRVAGLVSVGAVAAGLLIAGWLAWRRPAVVSAAMSALPFSRLRAALDRVQEFERATYGSATAPGAQLARVLVAQAAFHVLSFLEAWYTLWLLTGASLPLEAFVLDAFGRVSNVVFRVVPLRIGVDQAGAGVVAQAIGLDPVLGVSLSLVRTARLLTWVVVGITLVGRQVRKK
jgi:hypothetical protein